MTIEQNSKREHQELETVIFFKKKFKKTRSINAKTINSKVKQQGRLHFEIINPNIMAVKWKN